MPEFRVVSRFRLNGHFVGANEAGDGITPPGAVVVEQCIGRDRPVGEDEFADHACDTLDPWPEPHGREFAGVLASAGPKCRAWDSWNSDRLKPVLQRIRSLTTQIDSF